MREVFLLLYSSQSLLDWKAKLAVCFLTPDAFALHFPALILISSLYALIRLESKEGIDIRFCSQSSIEDYLKNTKICQFWTTYHL